MGQRGLDVGHGNTGYLPGAWLEKSKFSPSWMITTKPSLLRPSTEWMANEPHLLGEGLAFIFCPAWSHPQKNVRATGNPVY